MPHEKKQSSLKYDFEFESYFIQFIDEISNGDRLTREGKKYSHETVKAFKLSYSLIQRYKKQYRISTMLFRSFNKEFHKKLGDFMASKNYSLNYFSKVVKSLKTVLKSSYDEGFRNNEAFRDYSKPIEEVDHIALTANEVQKMYTLDLTKYPELELSREVFCLQYYTGLRVTDAIRIKPEYIKKEEENYFIELRAKKKPHPLVTIPIAHDAKMILEKYSWTIPKRCEQKINQQIKENAKLAGIDQKEARLSQGRKTKLVNSKRYELISTQTGRRTALTSMRWSKISLDAIQKISGHTTLRMLEKYLKIDSSESARIVADNSFFKSSPLKKVD